MQLTLAEVARVVGGSGAALAAGVRATGAAIDSRQVAPGDLFFALKGEFVDGHDYVAEALRRGAAAVVVERPVDGADPDRRIVVPDVAAGLAALGGWVRDVLNPVVVGITGSTGKTSVKDLLAAILRPHMPVVAAERSFNNDLGVPLTLLRTRSDTRVVLAEMGTRGPGQIERLCRVARPHLGVVTNIGVAHYETFGSRAAIARAKGELVEAIPEGGAVILNADDDLTPRLAARRRELVEVVTFGRAEGATLRASDVTLDRMGRPTFRMARGAERGVWVSMEVSGAHQVANGLAAAAAALTLGLTLQDCRAGLESAAISPWRMQVRRVGETVLVNDAYNANPASVAAALQTCAGMAEGGRLVAVLGHMAELGDLAESEHRRVGALAASLAHRLVVVGPLAGAIARGAREEGLGDVVEVADAEAAAEAIGNLGPGDVLLVKGSRVAGLESVADRAAERVASA